MSAAVSSKPAEILLVEDSRSDVRLTQEALKDSKLLNHMSVVPDGVEAMAFLAAKASTATRPVPTLSCWT